MDAKNLEVLRELKARMQQEEEPVNPAVLNLIGELKRVLGGQKDSSREKVKMTLVAGEPTEVAPRRVGKKRKVKRPKTSATSAKPLSKKQAAKLVTERVQRRQASGRSGAHVTHCNDCGVPLDNPEEILRLSNLCPKCLSRSRALDAAFRSRSDTEYTDVTLLPGGAPGLGKRH
ncbi:hypothetical protein [Pseudomonas sp.]|uniref:hypothetical protein n=1 Tax=Pseudomonas sp. TaxID=306 RepID=UPI003CC6C8E2